MKLLAKIHTKNLLKLINRCPRDSAVVINNDPYMPLTVVDRGPVRSGRLYTLGHYGLQNGDAMADPEVDFWVVACMAAPVSYRNDYVGVHQVPVEFTESSWKINPRLQGQITRFANMWLRNIHHQGFVNVRSA